MAEDFEWDVHNLPKIGRHALYLTEVEDALAGPWTVERPAYRQGGEDRRRVRGASRSGRILVVVFTEHGDRLRVVTAWPASPRDQRRYREGR